MRWIIGAFLGSALVGLAGVGAMYFVNGSNRTLEGLIMLALFVSGVGMVTSGLLFFMVGPQVLYDRLRQNKPPRSSK
jgi:hypothetical protein